MREELTSRHEELTGVIIAGGRNERMGQVKGLMPIADEPLIARTLRELSQVCRRRLLVDNEPERFRPYAAAACAELIRDVVPHRGPMSGLHAALAHGSTPYYWAVGSDMPFVSGQAAIWLLERLKAEPMEVLAIVPRIDGQVHPLHGVYRQECLSSMTEALQSERTGLIRWLGGIHALYVTEQELTEAGFATRIVDSFNDEEGYRRCVEAALS
ncbi:molybdenum cofactor guanylyltransferase [Paenibacillus sp. YYML68]|uniref:molybdenum cofactor guanylyltransferase n=1 Tax=Paenibacillus sp. YYML68 TaxID=2909250 RepID=UPI0024912AFA|nr:molybdenum cofactor guanylyltransferase [Paenibacillus sp. YYML68]